MIFHEANGYWSQQGNSFIGLSFAHLQMGAAGPNNLKIALFTCLALTLAIG